MKLFVILSVASVAVLAAPEGYNYKAFEPVVTHGNLNGFQPILVNGLPCSHASHHIGDTAGTEASLIQSQSTGRILNQKHHNDEHNLETAASGISSQTQAVTVNGRIVVGESGSSVAGLSQDFKTGQGYNQRKIAPPQTIISLPQLPLRMHATTFNPGNIATGSVVPSQVLSGQTQGGLAAHPSQHVHHHYVVPVPGAIVNGVGKVPPPAQHVFNGQKDGFQYASGFGGNKAASSQYSHRVPVHGSTAFGGHLPNSPVGPIAPAPFVNSAASQSLPHFGVGYAENFQHVSNNYASSFGQNYVQLGTSQEGSRFGSVQNKKSGSLGASSPAVSEGFGGVSSAHSSINSVQSGNALFHAVSSSNNALNGQLGHVIRETFANAPLDPAVEKHIYVHVPPEDLEENNEKHAVFSAAQSPKKHYKIIFIKAPSAPQPNYAQLASVAAQQSEEKTLVYVLVKKPDEPSLEELQQIQQSASKPSKPEVYFIKYKTRKEGEGQIPAHISSSVTGNTFADLDGANTGTIGINSVIGGVDNKGGIDIRVGGSESSSISSSSSSLNSASNYGGFGGKNHELYGVPLE